MAQQHIHLGTIALLKGRYDMAEWHAQRASESAITEGEVKAAFRLFERLSELEGAK